ncbi:unnamed protein product [Camellia sinensis]
MDFGLSVLIAMKATFLLLAFAYLRTLGFTLLSLPLLYASLVSMLLSIASHPLLNLPMLLGKNPDGTFLIWSLIMFNPYLYFVRGFSVLQRLWNEEAPYSEICEGLYVGGWPYSPEKLPPGNPAIVDCTCELPRNLEFSGHAYLCIPTWDTRAPQPREIESAVWWACRKRAQKIPIFIYYAYGVTITPEVASRNVNRAIMAELVKLYKESDLGKEMAVEGLFPGEGQRGAIGDYNNLKYPKLGDMLDYILKQQPALLQATEMREAKLLFPSKTYVAMIKFLLKCFEADAEQYRTVERILEYWPSVENMCLLLEHAMAYEGSVELHSNASKALITIGTFVFDLCYLDL